MILSRLVDHLKKERWTGVLIELVIVILGVFIGMQVTNWNQARSERQLAESYRVQIASDLGDLQRLFAGRIAYYAKARAFGERAIEGLASDAPLTAESSWNLILGLFQAGQMWPLDIDSTSYEEAKDAGVIRLVAGERVRGELEAFFELSKTNARTIDNVLPHYRGFIRQRIPWALQGPMWAGNCQAKTREESLYPDFTLTYCSPPANVSPALLVTVAEALKRDPEVATELNGRMAELTVIDLDYRNYGARAGRLAALLGRSSSVDEGTSAAPASADADKQRGSSP